MREWINGFLSNESSFGKLMTKCGIIIGANLLFVIAALPLVTMGPAWAALCHVMMKTLRGDGVLNPVREFFRGLRANFKAAFLVWIAALAMGAVLYLDVRFCYQASGWIGAFRYPAIALGIAEVIVLIYLYPVLVSFEGKIGALIGHSLYFAFHKPWKMAILLFFNVFPMYLTFTDPQDMPLYAFLWAFFGFGAIAMLNMRLLLPEFLPYLPVVDSAGDFILDEHGEKIRPGSEEDTGNGRGEEEKTEKEILKEMEKLGM